MYHPDSRPVDVGFHQWPTMLKDGLGLVWHCKKNTVHTESGGEDTINAVPPHPNYKLQCTNVFMFVLIYCYGCIADSPTSPPQLSASLSIFEPDLITFCTQ